MAENTKKGAVAAIAAAVAAANKPVKAPAAVEVSAKDAAKAVKRLVPKLDEAGKDTGEFDSVEVTADELLSWAKRGDKIIVVTTDGQKLEGVL